MKIKQHWDRKLKSRFTRRFTKICENIWMGIAGVTRAEAKEKSQAARKVYIKHNTSGKRSGRRFAKRK